METLGCIADIGAMHAGLLALIDRGRRPGPHGEVMRDSLHSEKNASSRCDRHLEVDLDTLFVPTAMRGSEPGFGEVYCVCEQSSLLPGSFNDPTAGRSRRVTTSG